VTAPKTQRAGAMLLIEYSVFGATNTEYSA